MKQLLLLIFWLLVPLENVLSQSTGFSIDITADPLMSSAQIVELSTLINGEGNLATRLFTVYVSNESNEPADDLYIDIEVISEREGLLMVSHQRNELPFGLRAGESAVFSNVDISRQRLPNAPVPVRFNGRLTENGRALLNKLQGVSTLPADEYTIQIKLYKRNNSVNGGLLLGSSSVTFGSNIIDENLTITLLTPGDAVGVDVTISNPNPEFRWDGLFQQSYRLIVVEASRDEDPEAMVESARSTPPTEPSGVLLEHEFLDVNINGTSFTYPSFGAKSLREGNTYYWQVFSELQTTSGTQERASEIWSFTLRDDHQAAATVKIDSDMRELLIPLIGVEQTESMIRSGFTLFEIELDGRVLTGEAAKAELMELLEKMRSNKIKLPE
ncbi:hypothetical protein [Rhodohalobacter halophilus]|uniref:hypothetical protein n=1 Tax=Rhodohalobacter halophilus TaxID=1812810 RepID=UPI00083F78CF|nr:hypothetical protein [Rhodohalobacter halophilus]